MSTLFGKKAKRKRSEGAFSTKDGEEVVLPEPKEVENEVFVRSPDEIHSFEDLGLAESLVTTCRQLGFRKPTPVQRHVIPFLVHHRRSHVLALAATGTGKTAAYVLPILHHLASDPYGIFAVILTPTRELAKQIHQQVLALGSAYSVTSVLIVGGLDAVSQACTAHQQHPHVCVATPGRLATLLRGPQPPRLQLARYLVLDEADRLLASKSGFEKDVAEILLHTSNRRQQGNRDQCQTLLFSATMTASLKSMQEIVAGDNSRLPMRKFVVRQDGETNVTAKSNANDNVHERKSINGTLGCSDFDSDEEMESTIPTIPQGLAQEYVFMPSRVREAYLLATVRTLLANGGRQNEDKGERESKRNRTGIDSKKKKATENDEENLKAKSAIIFVSTCERAALVSGILEHVGVANVALHSLLSQHRRLAALGKFQSEQVRVMVATDVAARGLDIPKTDLVINAELPRNAVNYVHRVGRTARAGRRGRAVSLVGENDVELVHAAEKAAGRELIKCSEITDEIAAKMLGPAAKASRLTKLKLADIGFDELVQKFKERKARDRKDRLNLEKALRKQEKRNSKGK